MNDIYSALKTIAGNPEARGVLVEVVSTEGSAPRCAGARMLLGADGRFSGTIGGGGLEFHAERDARAVLRSGEAIRKTYSLGEAKGETVGSVCGGSATLSFLPLCAQAAAVLLKNYPAPPRVLLYGAGHVGKALADELHLLGMDVVVTDERGPMLTAERFPHAERRLLPEKNAPVDAAEADFVVVMTHGHANDYALTLRALRSPAHYVGMIGSRKKNALFRPRFLADGIPQADIDARLHSPVGLAIGAETPEEIAVSIAAEIIADLRRSK